MQYLSSDSEIYELYNQSVQDSDIWREDYHEYERLADNGLIDDLDPSLPEVNDGSLAASLFKLPKRIVNSNLKGRAKAIDRDNAWLSELANMQWENEIIPNANSQAPFTRKWKDAVRKAAIYGSVPLITLFVERGDYVGSDFIVVQPQDVTLESGKVSDYDSDVVFWDVYYTRQQVKQMIETAKQETKEAKESNEESYNKWDVPALEEILKSKNEDDERDSRRDHKTHQDKGVRQKGIHFCVVFQRGVDAPFYMFHKDTKKKVRRWPNQDPTGDIPVHFLYCYQDFVNPYGIGLVKLAGGTQNVLDYMRQSDILATQLGFRPPVKISGDVDSADLDSIVYEQDAQWYVGNASVERQEISNQVYSQLPTRMSMYKTSLDQLLPMGDTSIAAGSGDPKYSKTPAGVKMQQSNLSIDDDDFKDNLYMTYEAVAKSMINIHFANMQGSDLMKLSDEERDILAKSGLDFPEDEAGEPTNELEVIWDNLRATFKFEIDPEQDKAKDEEKRLEALLKVAEFRASDPNFDAFIQQSGKKFNTGELYAEIINLTTDNDKIIEDISPEEMGQEQIDPATGKPMQPGMAEAPQEQATDMGQEMPNEEQEQHNDDDPEQFKVNVEAIMQEHGVSQNAAAAMLEAERMGLSDEDIAALKARFQEEEA